MHIDPNAKRNVENDEDHDELGGYSALHFACSNSSEADISELVQLLVKTW